MIANPDADAERLITYLPVFARARYTDMIAAIDARARGQVAEQFAARFAYLAQRLEELRDRQPGAASATPDPAPLADLAALASESAAGAAELCRRARHQEPPDEDAGPPVQAAPLFTVTTAAGKTQPAAYYLDAGSIEDGIG